MINDDRSPQGDGQDQDREESDSGQPRNEESGQSISGSQRIGLGLVLLTTLGIIADLFGVATFDISEVWFLRGEAAPGQLEGSIPSDIAEWISGLWSGFLQLRTEAPWWFVVLAIFALVATFSAKEIAGWLWVRVRKIAPAALPLLVAAWVLFPVMSRTPGWRQFANDPSGTLALTVIGIVGMFSILAIGAFTWGTTRAGLPMFIVGIVFAFMAFISALPAAIWWDGLASSMKVFQVIECFIPPMIVVMGIFLWSRRKDR